MATVTAIHVHECVCDPLHLNTVKRTAVFVCFPVYLETRCSSSLNFFQFALTPGPARARARSALEHDLHTRFMALRPLGWLSLNLHSRSHLMHMKV